MFFYFDYTYWLILIPAFVITMLAQANVSSTFNRYQRMTNRRGYTGSMAAQMVLRAHGVTGVRVERVSGKLTDHYDPRTNVIRLSDAVYNSTSVAAVGVAAHEAGHAVQYAVDYGPIRLRSAIIPVCNFGSQAGILLLVIGLIFNSEMLFGLGVVFFSLMLLFQLITLPVEFNASARAIATIDGAGLLDEDELPGAKKVLRAAALTYVAALLMSLLQLMRFVLIFIGRGGRDQGGSQ